MNVYKTAFAISGVLLAVGPVMAQQSMYTTSQLSNIRNQNAASGFSASRLRSMAVNRAVPQYGFSNVNRGLLSSATGNQAAQRPKPFSSISKGPSVTPYMGLVSDTPFTSTTTNYFTNVRPQLEQQKMNEKLQHENLKLQKQLNSVAARPPYDPTGSENQAPTGHAAVYMNNGGMYGNHGGYYVPVKPNGVRGRK